MLDIIKDTGDFIQNQVLKMEWLDELIGKGLSAVGVDMESRVRCNEDYTFTLCAYIYYFLHSELLPARENQENTGGT